MHNSKCLPCNHEHVCIYLKSYTSIIKTRSSIFSSKVFLKKQGEEERNREKGDGGLPFFLLSRKHVETASLFSSSFGLRRHKRDNACSSELPISPGPFVSCQFIFTPEVFENVGSSFLQLRLSICSVGNHLGMIIWLPSLHICLSSGACTTASLSLKLHYITSHTYYASMALDFSWGRAAVLETIVFCFVFPVGALVLIYCWVP